jgi:tetratricopeptide (TPR) repeat protein
MSDESAYADLEIRILARQPDGYRVEITLDRGIEFPPGELGADLLPWVPSASPAEDGERLFTWLFASEELKQAWALARGQHPQRRIRLRIDKEIPELHALPWELLRDPDDSSGAQDLAAATATPFSRYLAGDWQPGSPIQERPVKILVAIANPETLSEYGLGRLETDVELSLLERAIEGSDVELVRIPEPWTLAELEAALREGVHILHLVAHGAFQESEGAALYLADEDNQVKVVRQAEFAAMLGRQLREAKSRLRLVFLASCETATRSREDTFSGLAPALVAAEVPAVLAMQDRIGLATARAFARTFYERFSAHGLVDLACNEARSGLLTAGLPGAAIPTLFMRVKDGQLLAPAEPAPRRIHLWAAMALLAILVVSGLLWGWNQLNQIPPMDDGFNVAVAEFTMLGEDGQAAVTELSEDVSRLFYDALEIEVTNMRSASRPRIRGPEDIGPVRGDDPVARNLNAAEVASRHNASILVYGVVTSGSNGHAVSLEFYVPDEAFGYGSEAAGPNRLGLPIPFTPPLDSDKNEKLGARVEALRSIVSGLLEFSEGRYEKAWADFKWATDIGAWLPEEGKEVAWLLMGASKLRAYDCATDSDHLSLAWTAFNEARELNPEYARSYLGLGAAVLEKAKIHNGGKLVGVDEGKLIDAEGFYLTSLSAPDQPALAYVPARAASGLGQVHLLGFEWGLPGWSGQEAWDAFQQVVAEYEAAGQPSDLAWLAAGAHAQLGRLAGHNGDWDTMLDECRTAIRIWSDLPPGSAEKWIARYWSAIGIAQRELGNIDDARHALEQAIEIGTGTVSEDELQAWRIKLAELGEGGQ